MSRISIHSMEERLRFETLLSDLSTRFINLPTDKIDSQIVDHLKRIALVLKIDRCSVAEYNEDKTKLRQAIQADPLTSTILTLPEIDSMTQELFEENKEYMKDYT